MAVIGTPVAIGHNGAAGVTSVVTTLTGAGIANGDCVIVGLASSAAASNVATVVDSGGTNVYVSYVNPSTRSSYFFVCESAVALAAGGTVTANFNGAAGSHAVCVQTCTGLLSANAFGNFTGANATAATTITPPVLVGQVPNGLFIWALESATAGLGSFSAGTGYTLLQTQSASLGLRICYQIQTTTALSDAFVPTWTGASNCSAQGVQIKGATQPAQAENLAMLGVG